MAELWESLGLKYFAPVSEESFSIIEKLYDPAFLSLADSEEFDPNDPDKLLRFFNHWVQNNASFPGSVKEKSRLKDADNAFVHFLLACKYYYPLLTGNQHVAID